MLTKIEGVNVTVVEVSGHLKHITEKFNRVIASSLIALKVSVLLDLDICVFPFSESTKFHDASQVYLVAYIVQNQTSNPTQHHNPPSTISRRPHIPNLLKTQTWYLSPNVFYLFTHYCRLISFLASSLCIISAPNFHVRIPGTTIHAPLGMIHNKISRSRVLWPTSAYLPSAQPHWIQRSG